MVEESFVPRALRCSADFGTAVFLPDLGNQSGHWFCTITLQKSESSLHQATSSFKCLNFSKITSPLWLAFFLFSVLCFSLKPRPLMISTAKKSRNKESVSMVIKSGEFYSFSDTKDVLASVHIFILKLTESRWWSLVQLNSKIDSDVKRIIFFLCFSCI